MEKRNNFIAPVLLIDALQVPLGHRLFDEVVGNFNTNCWKEKVDAEKALSLVNFAKLKEARKKYFEAFAEEFENAVKEAKELGLIDETERKPMSPEFREYLDSIDFSKMKKPSYGDW